MTARERWLKALPVLGRLHRVAWLLAVLSLCVVGGSTGWWLLGPTRALLLVAATAAAAAGTYWLLVHAPQRGRAPIRWTILGRALGITCSVGLGMVGLQMLAGVGGPTLLALVLLAGPHTRDLFVQLVHPSHQPAHSLPSPGLATLSAEQLCRVWGASFDALEATTDARRLGVLAGLRRDYLDEMERRDPAGFDVWLTLHARAGGDPRPHLPLEGGPSHP